MIFFHAIRRATRRLHDYSNSVQSLKNKFTLKRKKVPKAKFSIAPPKTMFLSFLPIGLFMKHLLSSVEI